MIRSLVAAVVLFASGLAQAAGIYSGIWQDSRGNYIFVNQSGNGLIVTTYQNLAVPSRDIVITIGGQRMRPASLDVGDLISGTLVGNVARLDGIAAFRMCNVTYEVTFTSTSTGYYRVLGASATADGASQGVYCPGLTSGPNVTTNVVKVY